MKTVTNGVETKRVKNDEVQKMLSNGFKLCPKYVWKNNVRDINKKKEKVK